MYYPLLVNASLPHSPLLISIIEINWYQKADFQFLSQRVNFVETIFPDMCERLKFTFTLQVHFLITQINLTYKGVLPRNLRRGPYAVVAHWCFNHYETLRLIFAIILGGFYTLYVEKYWKFCFAIFLGVFYTLYVEKYWKKKFRHFFGGFLPPSLQIFFMCVCS